MQNFAGTIRRKCELEPLVVSLPCSSPQLAESEREIREGVGMEKTEGGRERQTEERKREQINGEE